MKLQGRSDVKESENGTIGGDEKSSYLEVELKKGKTTNYFTKTKTLKIQL